MNGPLCASACVCSSTSFLLEALHQETQCTCVLLANQAYQIAALLWFG